MSEAGGAVLLDLLSGFERQLLAAEVRRAPAVLDRLIADDFVEFGQSGRRYDKPQIIALLGAEPSAALSLDEFTLKPLGAEFALVTYTAERHVADAPPVRSRRSSIWRLKQDRWQLVFHQGTPLPTDLHEG